MSTTTTLQEGPAPTAVIPVRPGYIIDPHTGEARLKRPTDPDTPSMVPINAVFTDPLVEDEAAGHTHPEVVSVLTSTGRAIAMGVPTDDELRVPVDEASRMIFPPVCIKTGERTGRTITFEVAKAPAWTYLTLLLGILPGMLIVFVARHLRPHAVIRLPVARSVLADRHACRTLSALGIVLGLTAGVVSVARWDLIIGVLAFVLVVGGVLFGRQARHGGIRTTIRNGELVVFDASPEFRVALDDIGVQTGHAARVRQPMMAALAVLLAALLTLILIGLDGPRLWRLLVPDITKSAEVLRYARGEGGFRDGNDHGFTAVFPGEPTYTLQTYEEAGLRLSEPTFTDDVRGGAFRVSYVDMPAGVDLVSSDLLDVGLHAAAATEQYTIRASRHMTVRGDDAIAFLAKAEDDAYVRETYVRGRMILHDRRLYLLQVSSGSESPPGFGRFVDSFRTL
jgi:hypothetical protein